MPKKFPWFKLYGKLVTVSFPYSISLFVHIHILQCNSHQEVFSSKGGISFSTPYICAALVAGFGPRNKSESDVTTFKVFCCLFKFRAFGILPFPSLFCILPLLEQAQVCLLEDARPRVAKFQLRTPDHPVAT